MRLPLALLAAVLVSAALSGCATGAEDLAPTTSDPSDPLVLQGEQFEGSPEDGEPAGQGDASPASHGEPRREDGPVETGLEPTQVPGAYARRTVTITNGFDGADRGVIGLDISSGSITVLPGDEDGYRLEAVLEARGLTELDAQSTLERLTLTHTDVMEADGLHLTTTTDLAPAQEIVPGVQISNGFAWATLILHLPAGPAYEMAADTSAGDVSIEGLRGPSFTVDTSSGDIHLAGLNTRHLAAGASSGTITIDGLSAERAELQVSSGDVLARALRIATLVVDSSSGNVGLEGVLDTLEVDSSSGDVEVDAHGSGSGAYRLGTSSGSIRVQLLSEPGRAYRVTADTSSGEVDVDLPNSRSPDGADGEAADDEDEDGDHGAGEHVERESRDFEDARIRTIVEAATSSGDIQVLG